MTASLYTIVEEAASCDLATHYRKHALLTIDTIINIMRQLAVCLATLHQRDVAHGDLKLENLLLQPTELETREVLGSGSDGLVVR